MPATTPIATNGVFSIIYGVSDLAAAKAAFTALLGEPAQDSAYYVGWPSGDLQIGLDPNGAAKGATGPVPYWVVDDIVAALAALTDAGATVLQEPTDVGHGMFVALAKVSDGSLIGLTSR